MARLILFGGGDGGGIYITPNGIKRIPPWDPPVWQQIRGLSQLLNGSTALTGNAQRDMEAVTTKAAHVLVAELQASVGPLDGENTVVYADDDGGFTCGSTGKPFPFRWPRPKGLDLHVGPLGPRVHERDVATAERATVKMA